MLLILLSSPLSLHALPGKGDNKCSEVQEPSRKKRKLNLTDDQNKKIKSEKEAICVAWGMLCRGGELLPTLYIRILV